MAGFTKTLIVDGSISTETPGQLYKYIQNAVGYLTNGGTVIVEEFNSSGTGYEIEAAITLPDNITIIGRGNVLITVRSDTPAFYANGKERIVISGFRIKAERVAPSIYTEKVIKLENTKCCIVEKCAISVVRPSANSAGIYLYGSSDNSPAQGNIITECIIPGDGTNSPVTRIQLNQYCYRNMITNNTVYNCNENCSITNNSNHNSIMGNVFRNSSGSGEFGGLYMFSSSYNTLVGNECSGNAKRGIYLRNSSNCAVQGNLCDGNTLEGIRVGADSTAVSQFNSVTNNVSVNNGGTGILLAQYASYTAVDGNTAAGNTPSGNTVYLTEKRKNF